jgi:nucleoredoxin
MDFSQLADQNGNLRRPDGSSINCAEALKNQEVVGLYFSAHWYSLPSFCSSYVSSLLIFRCPPCKRFTPILSQRYTELRAAGKSFELIFVSSDNSEDQFNEYHHEMSFPAAHWSVCSEVGKTLSKKFKIQGIPSLILLDGKTGEVITAEGREELSSDSFLSAFPYRPEPFDLHKFLGPTLRTQSGSVATSDALAGKQALGLYFSAHWCPPCRGFTPTLCKNYEQLKAAGKPVELIFVSSDRDEASFTEYSNSMNFPAMPFSNRDAKAKLSKHFNVSGIPMLVFVDPATGKTINSNGRAAISASTFVEDFPYLAKPVTDVEDGPDGVNEQAALIVFVDRCNVEQKEAAKKALNAVAVAEKARSDADRAVELFFTVSVADSRMTQQFRRGAGYSGDEQGSSPQMAIFNLDDDGAVYRPASGSEVSEQGLQAFMQQYKAGALSRGTFGSF